MGEPFSECELCLATPQAANPRMPAYAGFMLRRTEPDGETLSPRSLGAGIAGFLPNSLSKKPISPPGKLQAHRHREFSEGPHSLNPDPDAVVAS